MGTELPPGVAVLAVGNPLYTDDGAGIAALRLLERSEGLPGRTVLIDGSLLGLEAASLAGGASRLLILDAVEAGAEPGTLIRMERDGLAELAGGSTVHRLGVADLLAVLKLLGRMPEEVVLLGLQPGSIEPGLDLTPPVSAGLGTLVNACLRQLLEWEAEANRRFS